MNLLKKLRRKLKKIKIKELMVILVAIFLFVSGAGLLWFSSLEIPDLSSFSERVLGESTKIFDRTGKVLLYDLGQNMRRTVVPFEDISPYVKNATISIEDNEFYNHNGFRLKSFMRAVIVNLVDRGYSQGGSTITQQVVKNSLLTRDKTITRKVKEIFLALKLEKTLTKNEILNLYLNETPYGGTLYGIEEASQGYFEKSSKELTLAEAAYLAALPQAPTYFSPFGSHRDMLEERKNLVLSKMKEYGYITKEEYDNALKEEVKFATSMNGGIKAPHFVMYVREYLSEKYGERAVLEGGLRVITTLDYELQKKAEEIVKRKALENGKLYNATNAGLVAIDTKTGQILVMVGSRDFFDTDVDGEYNIATAKRQPGSSFKPIIYSLAFEKGYRPETVVFDVPTQFSTTCEPFETKNSDGCYSPQNYDGKSRGPMSLRNALAQSINVPAVKMLYLVGIDNVLTYAKKLGITTLIDPKRYGLSLVLGGGEVTLLDMTGVYATFANNGIKNENSSILRVYDKANNTLEEWKENGTEVLSKQSALTLSDVLKDNAARTPVFGARSSLYFPDRDVAAKTGTTNDYRDAWVIGYTPQIAVGAWSGNNDNSPIDKQVAGYIVAPMWHEFMNELLKTLPDEKFEKPDTVDLKNLKPILRGDWQKTGNDGLIHSILQYVDKNDPLGNEPSNPYSDPQYTHWEYSVRNWANINGQIYENSNTTNDSATVSFLSPAFDENFTVNDLISVAIKTSSKTKITEASFFVDGIFIKKNTTPFSFEFSPIEIGLKNGEHSLKVVIKDINNKEQSSIINFQIVNN